MNNGVKIFYSIFVFLVLLGGGFIGIIFVELIGEGKFYTPLIAITVLILFVFFIVAENTRDFSREMNLLRTRRILKTRQLSDIFLICKIIRFLRKYSRKNLRYMLF